LYLKGQNEETFRIWSANVTINNELIGGERDPGFLVTGTKLGEQFSCLYFDRYMSID